MNILESVLLILGLVLVLISWIERKNLKILREVDSKRDVKRKRVISLETMEIINFNVAIIGIMLIISSILMFVYEFLNISP